MKKLTIVQMFDKSAYATILTYVALLVLAFVCEVTAQDLSGLAQIKPGKSRAVTSADPNPNSNADRIKYVTPGETKVLADIKGPGVISHIWLTFNEARELPKSKNVHCIPA